MPGVLRAVGVVEFESFSVDPARPSSIAEGPFAALQDLQCVVKLSSQNRAAAEQERIGDAGDGHAVVVDANLEDLQQELRAEAGRLLARAARHRLPR